MFNNLPGRMLPLPQDAMCENEGHETVPAVHCIQGETDSFGHEEICFCQPCYDAYREEVKKPKDGYCEWHKGEGTDITPYRDSDEGMNGPVYDVCAACRKRNQERLHQELDDDGYYD
jgi:hypothetical protein